MRPERCRPSLPVASEEMKAWSAAIGSELVGWPGVGTRSFFGFTALYRRDTIFALLPRTRGMETANSLAFKLDPVTPTVRSRLDQDPRIASTHMGKARWFTFEISSEADLHGAIEWLGIAYEATRKEKKPK